MTYTCKLCSATSDKVEFYKGVTSRCKECHKQKVRENRANNPEKHRAYDAMRFQRDEHRREANKAYAKTPVGKASMVASRKKWLESNPDKRAAHVILGNAVRDGRAFKPDSCDDCERTGKLHGHHEDYSKPLDVDWLCPACHRKRHA